MERDHITQVVDAMKSILIDPSPKYKEIPQAMVLSDHNIKTFIDAVLHISGALASPYHRDLNVEHWKAYFRKKIVRR